jgi:DNA-binding GntR family transcriptional regulator
MSKPPVVTTRTRLKDVHESIRADILLGTWRPGKKIRPTELADRYATSTTVVREALTRLAGEDFVSVEHNRGFFVPHLSLDELRDLTEVRCRTEGMAIEFAIQRGDLAWESELIAAHYQLTKTPRRRFDDPLHVADAWADSHRAFHAKLIEASHVPVLMSLSRQLADATGMYRRWSASSTAASGRDVEREHREILDATIARDANRATMLLRHHFETTLEVVVRSGLVEGVSLPG